MSSLQFRWWCCCTIHQPVFSGDLTYQVNTVTVQHFIPIYAPHLFLYVTTKAVTVPSKRTSKIAMTTLSAVMMDPAVQGLTVMSQTGADFLQKCF